MSETLLIERFDAVTRLTLNRPEKLNALDDLLIEELHAALDDAELDDAVRVVIIAGAGRSFCAGDDLDAENPLLEAGGRPSPAPELQAVLTGPEGVMRREDYLYYRKSLRLRDFRTPTIAQVQGWSVAAGMMLACMCDLIVAAENAKFVNPVLRQTNGGMELLIEPWEMGIRQAKEFLWTGDPISADDAYRLGMVNKVVPLEALENEALRLAQRIALTPPVVVQLVKRSINHALDAMGQRQSFEYHFIAHQLAHWTDESKAFHQEFADSDMDVKEYIRQRDTKYDALRKEDDAS